ncbi:AIR synthase family protein [Acetohalobium arabaticum]|uniref:AIR synthase related protein n=1 Tax=Acetohalobium arabaticum (strain ATCC 49924 / DSM 5501 / Z-7288) TaxID=574087 RepID=D9QQ79_ACEAZ|nr:AIR synthase family protein [Acetohalobium arabaticum]ADL12670.1 AIR synthase related protein [Acetohalobium arabaticum DSM 5501]
MKAGKLNINNLKSLILDQISATNQDVLVKPNIGEDSAVIDFGEFVAVISTDPITGVQEGMGSLAVNVACNDIAANGAEPIGIQQTLLVPPETTEDEIIAITRDINQGAKELGIDILGGHTEITDIVNKPLVSCTAIGKTTKEKFVTSSGAEIGDDIIVTKWTGLEGASILAVDYYNKLLELGVGKETLATAKNFGNQISVLPEGLIGAEFGVNAMHDVTEGGLYGSLYELTEAAETGFMIDQQKVPLHPATESIIEALELNPYQLIGSGMMILTTSRGEELIKELTKEDIPAAIVGEITESQRIIRTDTEEIELEEAPQDELWQFLADN